MATGGLGFRWTKVERPPGLRLGTAGAVAGAVCALPLLFVPALPAAAAEPPAPTPPEVEEEPAPIPVPPSRFRVPEAYLGSGPMHLRGSLPELQSSTRLQPIVGGLGGRPPQRLQVGDFALSASAALATAYDDNVDAENEDREAEIGANLSGLFRAQSLFARHSLGFQADLTVSPFAEDSEGDLFDWVVGADGQLDLTRQSSLRGAVTFLRGTESEESPEAEGATDRTVTSTAADVTYAHQGRRISWQIGGSVSLRATEEDGDDDSDRTVYTTFAGADYRLSRRTSLVVGAGYALNNFDAAEDDSQSFDVSLGLSRSFGRTFSVSASLGYSRIFFDEPESEDTQAIIGFATLDGTLRLDRYTNLALTLDRSLDPVSVDDASSAVVTQASARIDRTLSPVSRVSASLDYTYSDYNEIARTDHDTGVALGYRRSLNRIIALNLGYRFSQRFSDDPDDEFYRNIVTLGLSANL